MSALALFAFASCNPDDKKNNDDLDNVILDGFYVAGDAVGTSDFVAKNMMSAGFNEVEKKARDGMYEKYVILEGGKDFYLSLNEAGNAIRYAADLLDVDLTERVEAGEPAYADNPKIVIKKGELVTGDDSKVMRVSETGLYHIILDLNKAEDLEFPQIVIAPCQFKIDGGIGKKEMTLTVDGDKYIYTWQGEGHMNPGNFKFVSCDGWKITLDVDGLVKAETSLGVGMLQTGGDIPINPGEDVKITLTYQAAAGDFSKNFSYTVEGTIENYGPADWPVGISGDLHASVGNWADPAGATLAVYSESESGSGTYVYNITGCPIKANAMFKMRANGEWIGYDKSYLQISGIETTGTGDIAMGSAEGTYNIKITIAVDGSNAITSYKAAFTRTGDLPAVDITAKDLVIGISGEFGGTQVWVDPAGKYRAEYSESESNGANSVYNITDFVLKEGDTLKFRFDGSWEGDGFAPIEGIVLVKDALSDNLYVNAAAAGTYDIKLSCDFTWDGENKSITNKAVKFTKK